MPWDVTVTTCQRKVHKKMEHRHQGLSLVLVHPGSCLLHWLVDHPRKCKAGCMGKCTMSRRRTFHLRELDIPRQQPERRHQRLQHYRKEMENPHQEPHLLFHRGTQSRLRPRSRFCFGWGCTPCTHHEAASTMYYPSVKSTSDSTHDKEASGADPAAMSVDNGINRYLFRVSEEENWIIKIPRKFLDAICSS